MHVYELQVRREGRWWLIDVPEIDQVTQARRLSEVRDMARSLIALTLDVPPASFEMSMHIENIGDVPVDELVGMLNQERRELEDAQGRYRTHQKQLARELVDEGVPIRDVGEIIGVSFQRVQQLVRN